MIKDKLNSEFYYYFQNGTLTNAYDYFGAHLNIVNNEVLGCEFFVYAPNARYVNIIGEFNNYAEQNLTEIQGGYFYGYFTNVKEYDRYKYVLYTYNNRKLYKADPYAFYSDLRSETNSRVYNIDGYIPAKYKRTDLTKKPLSIYELHLGSWKRDYNNNFIKYNDIKDDLIAHVKANNFTHVEIMPIAEHPLDDSWGYMATGYYSATSRFGSPKDLMYLVDELHRNNIGVIFDWVPSHICRDDFGLYMFDGNPLYEYNASDVRENDVWGTANLDLEKGITKSFLISNAFFWLKYFQVDGFRIDAVSTIIYWMGDASRGPNLGAIEFLKHLSSVLYEYDNNVLLIAEDSSAYPNVTKSASEGGIGFNYKWNMGWMNDTLKYFELDPIYRKYHHNLITFSFVYIFNERFILPISHDEVVHLKKSLLNKMPGTYDEKFSNLRLFFGYMYTFSAKKLLFMGQEFGQFTEWNFNKGIDLEVFKYEKHQKLNLYFRDLNKIYTTEKVLYETDFDQNALDFIEPNNQNESIFVYARSLKDEHLIVILNATPNYYDEYKVGVFPGKYYELINSDNAIYGGYNGTNNNIVTYNEPMHNKEHHVKIKLPGLSCVILKSKKNKKITFSIQ